MKGINRVCIESSKRYILHAQTLIWQWSAITVQETLLFSAKEYTNNFGLPPTNPNSFDSLLGLLENIVSIWTSPGLDIFQNSMKTKHCHKHTLHHNSSGFYCYGWSFIEYLYSKIDQLHCKSKSYIAGLYLFKTLLSPKTFSNSVFHCFGI